MTQHFNYTVKPFLVPGNADELSLLDHRLWEETPTSRRIYKELLPSAVITPRLKSCTRGGKLDDIQLLKGIMAKRVAVILSGCGVYDGTEIHEASAVLVHLSRAGAKVQMFAPNSDQMHVVNHCEGKPTEEKRNILQESARIARGKVTDLAKLDVSAFDAAIIPGGFGVAKNLSDWAVKNKDCAIQPQLEKVIKDFHNAGKPLGMCCIAPVLAAKILPGCELTVGQDKECEKWPYAQTADALKEMGCKHVNKDVEEAHVDVKNKLVTTSAFMCNAPIHKVYDGIGVMVKETLKLA